MKKKIKKRYILLALIILVIIIIFLSQIFAYSPNIKGEDGKVVQGSMAKLEKIKVNSTNQWITIRGHDKSNPVLLFLAGGPGGSQLVETREYLKELEKDFVIVNWDQPGSGKSFNAVDYDELNKERYIEDAHALTEYLKERFNKDKIFIMGQSWGTALSVWLGKEYPEDYYAIINSGQMVDFVETERICYDTAFALARERKDEKLVNKLIEQGRPPYSDDKMVFKTTNYLMYLSKEMSLNPNISGPSYSTISDIMSTEYGFLDKLNYIRGATTTFNEIYPKLYDESLVEDIPIIDVPLFILHGKYDLNAPVTLVEEFYNNVQAPLKECIWFENSGHTPWRSENQRFVDEVRRIKELVLAEYQ